MRSAISLFAVAAGLVLPSLAFGFCRTTTCAQQDPPLECVPGVVVGSCQTSGRKLFWPRPCVSFSVQRDGSPRLGITADQLEEIVRASFDNWQTLDCPDGGKPNISIETFEKVDCAEARYNQGGPNQNLWLFRDDDWPHEGDGDRTIALTLVSFQRETGEIYDVDVELNSWARNFKLETTGAGDDLWSVVQHESGHFLGLAHSDNSEATMWSNYNGSVDMRSLEPDDAAGICSVFPAVDKPDATCDATPRHGFSTQCTNPPKKGCTISRVGDGTDRATVGLLWLAGLGALIIRLRRRHKNG